MTDVPSVSLDLARLDVIADGDPEVIAAVLELYVQTADETLATLADAAQRVDRVSLASAAHRLRGSSSAAGAPIMASLASSLESGASPSGAEDVVAMATSLLEALRAELVCVRAAIARASAA